MRTGAAPALALPLAPSIPLAAALLCLAALCAAAIGGCAPAVPTLLGGGSTPADRVDLGVGGAVRAPVGDLVPPESATPAPGERELLAFAEPGGVVPVAWARYGIARRWALGVLASGSTARLELIGEARLSPFLRLVGGIAPYGGYAIAERRQDVGGGEGWRAGALAPLAIAFAGGGVLEGWLGVRAGFEHAEGDVGPDGMRVPGNLSAFRAGGFVGIAAGLRRVHVVVELAADYEYWRGALGGVALERQGLALTPAFALRIRI